MIDWAVATIAVVLVVGVASMVLLVAVDQRGKRPAIVVGPMRRSLRALRSTALRIGCAISGWPHLVDLAVGTASTPLAPTPSEVIGRFGPASLHRYGGGDPDSRGEPVLVLPSLVTRPWVLDLTLERTMIGSLLDSGFDVWLLDWGHPSAADAERTLNSYAEMVGYARHVMAERTRQPCHVIGYCLGATVAIIDGATAPSPPSSLAFIAPVAEIGVSEHSGRIAGIGRYIVMPWAAAGLALDHRGLVPGPVIREAFHLLRPRALRTVWARLRMPAVAELQRAYGAMARWTWEQTPLPGGVFLDLVELHRSNSLALGRWMTPRGRVDLGRLTMPILIAYSEHDHIVASRAGFLDGPHVEQIGFPSGHVGMLVGNQAPDLYATLVDFLRRQSLAGTRPSRGCITRTRTSGSTGRKSIVTTTPSIVPASPPSCGGSS